VTCKGEIGAKVMWQGENDVGVDRSGSEESISGSDMEH
jgi:hypothetical protein